MAELFLSSLRWELKRERGDKVGRRGKRYDYVDYKSVGNGDIMGDIQREDVE